MNLPPFMLAASLLLVLPPTQAQSACPWLTEGTAAAALGGPVLAAVQLHGDPNRPVGTCIFSRQQAPLLPVLEIAVSGAPLEPGCPAHSAKLAGIGNEATFCRQEGNPSSPAQPPARSVQSPAHIPAGSPGEARYAINSRVRDLYFRVSLRIPAPAPAPKPLDDQREQIQLIAEQVAGNLY